jgi:hypothetical protein
LEPVSERQLLGGVLRRLIAGTQDCCIKKSVGDITKYQKFNSSTLGTYMNRKLDFYPLNSPLAR